MLHRWMIVMLTAIIYGVSTTTYAEDDVHGWRDAIWGMTNEQLIEAFPGEATKLPKRISWQRWYTDYAISNYEISGSTFQVFFQMSQSDQKLSQILIQNVRKEGSGCHGILFDSLRELLVRKYYVPTYETRKEITWVFPTTTIRLDFFCSVDQRTSIIYFPTVNSETNKL